MLPFLFQINGVTVEVVTDNDIIVDYIKTDILPCAMVDTPSRNDIDGTVYVPAVFHKLTKKQQTLILSHECGHVALGHLSLAKAGELLINESIEAEADKWAVDIHGVAAYTKMINDLTQYTLDILKEYISDESVYNKLVVDMTNQANKRIANFMLLY